MPVRTDLNGTRFRSKDPKDDPRKVYLVVDGLRHWIPDSDTYENLFRDWDGIEEILDLNDIDPGDDISHGAVLARPGDRPPVYLVADTENGRVEARHIATSATMDRYYFHWGKVVSVPEVVLNAVPPGPDIA